MEGYRQAVMGLPGGDVEDSVLDVHAAGLDHIGIAELYGLEVKVKIAK